MNFDSSSFIAEKELIEALEKRSSTIVCEEERKLFTQGGKPTWFVYLTQGNGNSLHGVADWRDTDVDNALPWVSVVFQR